MKICRYLLLLLSLSMAFLLRAEPIPDWLQELDSLKHRQPEQSLAILTARQPEFSSQPDAVKAYWLRQQAALYSALGRHQQQQQAARQALELLQDTESALKVEVWYELGYALEMQVQLTEALSHYQQGTALATLLDNEKLILRGQINQAAIMSEQNNDQQALTLLKDVYQRAELLQDPEVLAEVNAQLGLMYSSLAFEDDALEFLQRALVLYQQLGWVKNEIAVLFNLARTYSYQENYQQALDHFNQMLQRSLAANDSVNLYHAYLGLAITSAEMSRTGAALGYIEKAEQYLANLQSSYHVQSHHYEKALIYRDLEQTSLAMQQVMLAEQASRQPAEQADHVALAIKLLRAELLAQQDQYQKAYFALHDFIDGFQQLRNKENELALEQIRLEFDSERQQVRTSLLEAENELKALRLQEVERKRQIQLLWLGILGCTTLILLGIVLWQFTRRAGKTRREKTDLPL
ncbi:Tetratricopeptide repeat-containing protein [Arsukibacterium tuosuense]|uniref:Tetratricopeptide repeat-containing protein n=1 Tax=Arsukibacterium tuosuense TaxID=1323745 RepID=A0A285IWY8_9GAMM|nr:tetratricopeptide repeat protein [Arsukibacterium tuosuense]SNY52343.1 Tetratricopeptide repeat-containing protein [Arsukibacterium tuosuense]